MSAAAPKAMTRKALAKVAREMREHMDGVAFGRLVSKLTVFCQQNPRFDASEPRTCIIISSCLRSAVTRTVVAHMSGIVLVVGLLGRLVVDIM
jgi:hypothetical protein